MSRLFSQHWKDYELIDAGGERKLERWGSIVTIRPDRNAYFAPVLPKKDWLSKAHFEFVEETKSSGQWKSLRGDHDKKWTITYNDVKFNLNLTKFKHLGIFPEQQANWEFLENNVKKGDRLLNLFGYTGAASLIAKAKGADVFHVDSVKQVINWGKENMETSGLSDIHWVLEDALKFAQREVKRGHKYDGIIMDPPAFGIGAKKERWKIENKFPELLETALQLKNPKGFIISNTYSP
ncbi:MAG: 23S rRNA (cytosine1962-C5)-methyltransferase, partial [Arenicella sp.]